MQGSFIMRSYHPHQPKERERDLRPCCKLYLKMQYIKLCPYRYEKTHLRNPFMIPKCSSLNSMKHLPRDLKVEYCTAPLCQTANIYHALMKIHLFKFMPIMAIVLPYLLKGNISNTPYLFCTSMFKNTQSFYFFTPHKCCSFAYFISFCYYQKGDVKLDSSVNIEASTAENYHHLVAFLFPECKVWTYECSRA